MLLVKLIEPPCTEPYARWCERSKFLIYEKFLLLDHCSKREPGSVFWKVEGIFVVFKGGFCSLIFYMNKKEGEDNGLLSVSKDIR